jgi:hypothetical protein
LGFLLLGANRLGKAGKAESIRRKIQMADQTNVAPKTRTLSLDGWAVAIALLLTALVRMGVLKHISW